MFDDNLPVTDDLVDDNVIPFMTREELNKKVTEVIASLPEQQVPQEPVHETLFFTRLITHDDVICNVSKVEKSIFANQTSEIDPTDCPQSGEFYWFKNPMKINYVMTSDDRIVPVLTRWRFDVLVDDGEYFPVNGTHILGWQKASKELTNAYYSTSEEFNKLKEDFVREKALHAEKGKIVEIKASNNVVSLEDFNAHFESLKDKPKN